MGTSIQPVRCCCEDRDGKPVTYGAEVQSSWDASLWEDFKMAGNGRNGKNGTVDDDYQQGWAKHGYDARADDWQTGGYNGDAPENEEASSLFELQAACNPGEICDFEVTLTKKSALENVGFKLKWRDNSSAVVIGWQGSVIEDWQSNNPTKRIRLGDQMRAVNGTFGTPSVLVLAMKEQKTLQIQMRRQVSFALTMVKPMSSAPGLGLEFDTAYDGEGCEITHIHPMGLIWHWNSSAREPMTEFHVGDVICAVNGVKSSIAVEVDTIKDGDRFSLTIERPRPS